MQIFVNGLILGCIYALIALGFSITYTTTRTLNFAQGELVMVGAMLGIMFHATYALSLPVSITLSAVAVAALSVAIYWGAIAAFNKKSESMGWVLATFGVSVAVRALSSMAWGKAPLALPPFFGDDLIQLGPIVLQTQQILIVVSLLCIVTALNLFVHRTYWGKALLAVAQNPKAAALSGISPSLIATIAFAISGALAAGAGLLIAPVTFVSVDMGSDLLIKSFTICVIAGLSSFWGTVGAGLLFGLYEALVARYLGNEFRDVFGLLLLVGILAFRPTGLFSTMPVEKV